MTEMVERVARALREKVISHVGEAGAPKGKLMEFELTIARAAIEAMREPTEGMRFAGITNNHGKYADAAWQAMIDEALR